MDELFRIGLGVLGILLVGLLIWDALATGWGDET